MAVVRSLAELLRTTLHNLAGRLLHDRRSVSLLLLLMLGACAATPQTDILRQSVPSSLTTAVNLSDVAFFPQDQYQCGPAALATVLTYNAVAVTADDLVSQVYIPSRQGSLQIEMLAATRRHGQIAYVLSASLSDMLQEVGAGKPVLVMQNLGLSRLPQWHYAVVVGYDLERAEIRLRSGTIRDYVMPLGLFEKTWARADHWAMMALKPGELPLQADEAEYFQRVADFEQINPGEMAVQSWRAGVQRWPHSRLLNMGLSNQLYAQGDLLQAAEVLQRLLANDAGAAAAHNNLAWISLELGDVVAALSHARQAVQLEPGNSGFSATLAEVQSKTSSGK